MLAISRILIFEQTEILLGNRKNYSDTYFRSEKDAITFIRYMVKMYLHCDSLAHANATITCDMLRDIELSRAMQVIDIPKYLYPEDQDEYLIDRIFTPRFDPERWMRERYCKQIIEGTFKKFPKYYMTDDNAKWRASECLKILLRHDYPMMTVFELYKFSTTSAFREYLKKKVLWNTCSHLFPTPVDFVHSSLKNDQKDPFLFMMFKANYILSSPQKLNVVKKSVPLDNGDDVA